MANTDGKVDREQAWPSVPRDEDDGLDLQTLPVPPTHLHGHTNGHVPPPEPPASPEELGALELLQLAEPGPED
jgi:hypothetical protein